MRTILENVRQTLLGSTDKEFTPTPNVRNPAMLEEAETFLKHMIGFKRNLRAYQGEVGVFLKALPVINKGNLPRVWETVEGGLCEPTRPSVSHDHPIRIGASFDESLLRDTKDIMDRRIDEDIIRPIDAWAEGVGIVRERMYKLDRLRLDVDARRRRMIHQYKRSLRRLQRHRHREQGMHGGVTTARVGAVREGGNMRTGGVAYGDVLSDSDEDDTPAAQRTREDVMREALYFQRKLEAVQESYDEQEQLVWEQLAGLVRDAAWLEAYMAGSFLIVKEAMQAAAVAMRECKQPLPGYGLEATGAREYGVLGDNMALIQAVPPAVERGPAGVAPPLALRGTIGLPNEVRPSRATAQPLQVAADYDRDRSTPRFEPIPPVARGQPDVAVVEPAAADVESGHGLASGGSTGATAARTGDGNGLVGIVKHALTTYPANNSAAVPYKVAI